MLSVSSLDSLLIVLESGLALMLAYTDRLVGGANYAGCLVNPNYLLMDWNRR